MIENNRKIWYYVGKIFPEKGAFIMMLEKNLRVLNEIIVGSSRPEVAKLLSRLKREGKVVRIAPRIYTTN